MIMKLTLNSSLTILHVTWADVRGMPDQPPKLHGQAKL
jgi:hypothetical protein